MVDCNLLLSSPGWNTDTLGKLHIWQSFLGRNCCETDLKSGFADSELSDMRGNWALVDLREDSIVIVTDLVRSHPLVYTFIDGCWVIADDIENLRGKITFTANAEQIAIFEHTAVTYGDQTLVKGVYSTPAATITELFADGTKTSRNIIGYKFADKPLTQAEKYKEAFTSALNTVFRRLISDSAGRELVIPLSGGLDSRLIALWLKKLNAPNVTCFTYGKPGSAESLISKEVAEDLGFKWKFIPMNALEVSKAWQGKEADQFLRATWKGTSLPHIQDWYALRQMKIEGLLSPDAIFLPGHTIVGNMHDEELVGAHPTEKILAGAMLKHHANMQGKWRKAWELPMVRKEIKTTIANFCDSRERKVQEIIEWFNIVERQAKYINNSMASYEYFGFSWALPMIETEMVDVWLQGSEQFTLTRKWYAEFVNAEFASQTGKKIQLFEPPSTKMPKTLKKMVLAGIRAIKADVLISRYRSGQTVVNHPMGFEAFTNVSSFEQRIKMMIGANQLGFWIHAFLNNSWGGQKIIVPTSKIKI